MVDVFCMCICGDHGSGNGRGMEVENLLHFAERAELRRWLMENHTTERVCWVVTSRAKQPPKGVIPYLEVVEEALCFGWIDSTVKRLDDGRLAQRLSPRRKRSHWTGSTGSVVPTLSVAGL